MARLSSDAEVLAIYWETLEPLYGYASRRCGGDRDLAEDVTQETWLRALRNWPRKGVPEKPLAWLMTVARNLIINQMQKRERAALDLSAAAEVLAAVDDDAVSDSAEIASAVTQALTKLPRDEAAILEAFHFERSRVAQIAESYGVTERAIEGRLRRAREHLRHELEIILTAQRGMA